MPSLEALPIIYLVVSLTILVYFFIRLLILQKNLLDLSTRNDILANEVITLRTRIRSYEVLSKHALVPPAPFPDPALFIDDVVRIIDPVTKLPLSSAPR